MLDRESLDAVIVVTPHATHYEITRTCLTHGLHVFLEIPMTLSAVHARSLVDLAETLRPYRRKWMEECLIPEDLDAHVALRERLPWQTLATGEHWYTHVPF